MESCKACKLQKLLMRTNIYADKLKLNKKEEYIVEKMVGFMRTGKGI